MFDAANDPIYDEKAVLADAQRRQEYITTMTEDQQPVYNVYRGKGITTTMTYRVNIRTGQIQFYCATHWALSERGLPDISKDMPLGAKNVRFKA